MIDDRYGNVMKSLFLGRSRHCSESGVATNKNLQSLGSLGRITPPELGFQTRLW
jgi:hypothetical protein